MYIWSCSIYVSGRLARRPIWFNNGILFTGTLLPSLLVSHVTRFHLNKFQCNLTRMFLISIFVNVNSIYLGIYVNIFVNFQWLIFLPTGFSGVLCHLKIPSYATLCLVCGVWCLWCLVSLENTLSCYIFDQTTCDLNNVYTMTKQGSGHQSLDC